MKTDRAKHEELEPAEDLTNPYQAPSALGDRVRVPAPWSMLLRVTVLVNGLLIPTYLLVFAASIVELSGVDNLSARGAVDYWRHAVSSFVFLSICIASVMLAHRGSRWTPWCLAMTPLLLLILIFPGLNRVWNALLGVLL